MQEDQSKKVDPMDAFRKKEDYREACQKLDGLHSQNKENDETKYLMLFKKQETSKKDLCVIIRVYNGNMLWMQKIDRAALDEMILKTDIKGTYSSFCELIRFAISENSYDFVQFEAQLDIVLYFSLQRHVQLKGQIPLDQGLPITNDEDIRKIQFQFVCDLVDVLKATQLQFTKEIEVNTTRKKKNEQMIDVEQPPLQKPPPPPKKNLLTIGQEILNTPEVLLPRKGPYGIPFYGNQYVQFPSNADLINPSKKKRKTNGGQID
ncbi:unnamed protein product (macronuclear) [Paramecium tetraurelia]|uniref:Uncharacterized protein n=1 Tax=Paramecium tetraurelia TaxID=5888 RepID=A0CSG3_PARTE|nr:uncharacterized protein GSPATT00010002001 [Paramecium tetraurelia]CAK73730.1 unnamed protein product [Paramecium tetraurelia]|eukprot:XP_001441127.1 hypothetical protein (macronuclear) [Paramecium tetraurelia strain d4-2]